MNLNEIISKLNLPELSLRMYFVRKQGIKYISYSPTVERDLQVELIGLIIEYLNKFVEYEQKDFSPVGYIEGTIEACDCSYVEKYEEVIDSFSETDVQREPLEEKHIKDLGFYCLVVTYKDGEETKDIKFFRRVTKFKRLASKGIFGSISDNRFNRVDSNLLGIDGDVDIVVFNGKMLILNHISLERIFSLADQFLEKAQGVIDVIRNTNRISNFEQFEIDCLNDRRITRTLTKMLSEMNILENCFMNFANVVNVIDMFELDIDIDNSSDIDVIIYDSKDQLMDIIRIVRDSYYKSIINDRKGIDDAI